MKFHPFNVLMWLGLHEIDEAMSGKEKPYTWFDYAMLLFLGWLGIEKEPEIVRTSRISPERKAKLDALYEEVSEMTKKRKENDARTERMDKRRRRRQT